MLHLSFVRLATGQSAGCPSCGFLMRASGSILLAAMFALLLPGICDAQHHGGNHGGGMHHGGVGISGGHLDSGYGHSGYGHSGYGHSGYHGIGHNHNGFGPGYGSGFYGGYPNYSTSLFGSSYYSSGFGTRFYGGSPYFGNSIYANPYPNVSIYNTYSAPIIVAPQPLSRPVVFRSTPSFTPGDPLPPQETNPAPEHSASGGDPASGELRPGMVLPDGAVVISVDPPQG